MNLRTPLNGIAASHELIRDTPLSPEQREYVQHIGAATELLVSLMNDILEYSRLEEGGGAEPRPAPFDLVEHMEGPPPPRPRPSPAPPTPPAETAALLAGGARSKGVELLLLVPPAVPRLVVGESFSERGGRVELRVDLAARGPGASATLRFTVTDTGIGIAKEHQHLLFRPYGQLAADDVTRMYGGTGLGLAIAKRLAESLGGAVGVESEPGRGSRFWATAVLQLQECEQPEWPRLRGAVCTVLAASAGVADLLDFYVSQWGGTARRGASAAGQPNDAGGAAVAIGDAAALAAGPLPRRRALALLSAKSEEAAAARVAAECIGSPVLPSQLARALLRILNDAEEGDPPGSPAGAGAGPPASAPAAPPPSTAAAPSPAEAAAAASAGTGGGAPAGRVRVLLVDDVRTNLVLAKKMLELGGCEVATAEDGLQCIEAYRADPARVDLILLDVEMPVCDGRRACSQIRALEASGAVAGRVPIVYLSANAMPEDQEEALRLGGDAFLCKPIRRQVLMEAVARHSRRAPPPPPEPEAPAR
eukprot:tig00021462_g21574.t1